MTDVRPYGIVILLSSLTGCDREEGKSLPDGKTYKDVMLVGNAHPTVYQGFWRAENAEGERAIQLKI